jgi:hypothetical protein
LKKACKGKRAVITKSEDEGTINNKLVLRSKYNVLDKILYIQKNTRVKTKRRVLILADAEPMLEICLYYTRDVCFSSFYFYTILILEA